MPGDDKVILVVGEWVSIAEDELISAQQILALGATAPTHPICFHAHQCIEKYLKGLLAARGIAVPKTHDLGKLLASLPAEFRPAVNAAEIFELNLYAADARYPGSEEISPKEAIRAVEMARRIRDDVRSRLPPQALAIGRRRT